MHALVDAGERFVRPKPPQRPARMGDIISIDLSDPPPPEHWSKQPPRELQWRGRFAVKQIAAQPDGVDEFLRILELGPPLTGRAAARRAAVLDDMIEETEASLAAIINAAESARRKRRGAPCPECGKRIRAETRKPRRRFDPPARYKIVNGHVKTVPRKTRMVAEYSEHGVYDFYREISAYPDDPDGIWQTRRGPHRCPERLAKKLQRLRAEREELSVDQLPAVHPPDPVNRTRARIAGIDRALGRLQPGRDRERIAWLTSKRTYLVQELKLERSRRIASGDLPLEQRLWLKLSEGRATAAGLADDLHVGEAEVAAALDSLEEKDWARLHDARKGIWCALGVGWTDERLPWEEIEEGDDDG